MRFLGAFAVLAALTSSGAVAVYPHRMDPRRHPDESRRTVKPPSYESFGRRMQFIALRGTDKKAIERYIDRDGLGNVVWPPADSILVPDITNRVAELKKRGLYLFAPWGFVPGSGRGGTWRQYRVPQATLDLFESELGDRWLGMDNGEQDGRYMAFSQNQIPFGRDRIGQYLNFQRHFERLDAILGNKMAALVSLNYGHYFLRENCYTMIGAETAQALPNAQVYYSWIRGAGKQYGVPWFGNVSSFNRWGWKAYPRPGTAPADPFKGTPAGGTSLALLKKLMYAQICYNSLAVGFEMGLYRSGVFAKDGGEELSPLGRIHKGAMDWCARYGDTGVHHAPVAVMTDFFAGWTFPRHLYTGQAYLVWGQQPYDLGDHLTDGVLDMIYPGYFDSSYWKDERGFNVDTPYGDIADCILSDAPSWVLGQYSAVILAGTLRASDELRDTLLGYVRGGGELCLTKGNARTLFPDGFKGVDLGSGRVTPLPGGDWGVEESVQCSLPVVNRPMEPFSRPHPLKPSARAALDRVLRRQAAFVPSSDFTTNGLAVISCRRGKGEWTVCVLNNTWTERPLRLHSNVGRIVSVEELPTPTGERLEEGFFPNGLTNFTIGADSPATIAGGAVRLMRVRTDEGDSVRELPAAVPPKNVSNAVLALRGAGSVKEQVLRRPTFFRHYGGVMVDWTYLACRDAKTLAEERNWIDLQGLKVLVDMSGGFNLFPDLRMVDNDPAETARTDAAFDDVLSKMRVMGAETLIVAPSKLPETNMARGDAVKSMKARLLQFADRAAAYGVTVHLRNSPRRLMPSPQDFEAWTGSGRARPAVSLAAAALWCERKRNLVEYVLRPGEKKYETTGHAPVYLLAAPGEDEFGQLVSLHRPIASQTAVDREAFEAYLRMVKAKGAMVVYDALYSDTDEEYRDARYWEGL